MQRILWVFFFFIYLQKSYGDWAYSPPVESSIVPKYRDGRFYNHGESHEDLVSQSFWLLFPGALSTPYEVDLDMFQNPEKPLARSRELHVQWIGHSSVLLQIANYNFLFDPLFYDVTLWGVIPLFYRYTPPGISLLELPQLDGILFSHNHQDHCDLDAMQILMVSQPHLFTPEGMGEIFQEMGFEHVHDHNWWSKSVNDGIEISCVPARHWSCRGGNSDANFALWCGWVIQADNHTIYFAGDTAYDEELFNAILDHFGPIDLLFMPIAPEGEQNVHVNLEEALLATRLINPKIMIPIHWGTLRTGTEKIEDPYFAMQEALSSTYSDLKNIVHILKLGEKFSAEKRIKISDVIKEKI